MISRETARRGDRGGPPRLFGTSTGCRSKSSLSPKTTGETLAGKPESLRGRAVREVLTAQDIDMDAHHVDRSPFLPQLALGML